MRIVAGAAGALLVALAFGLIVVVAMSIGGADLILVALLLSAALAVGGVALIRWATTRRSDRT